MDYLVDSLFVFCLSLLRFILGFIILAYFEFDFPCVFRSLRIIMLLGDSGNIPFLMLGGVGG